MAQVLKTFVYLLERKYLVDRQLRLAGPQNLAKRIKGLLRFRLRVHVHLDAINLDALKDYFHWIDFAPNSSQRTIHAHAAERVEHRKTLGERIAANKLEHNIHAGQFFNFLPDTWIVALKSSG